ncbi:hypothetical protein TTHERM_00420370 (macronuclear) [Tetrahymena thermophila SB210]|uniref:Uncharacterized protein n=1 Tax=Tetrahymena thermophila (strain SB210) TaxID=312017 RepID=I7M077_TETTS|nr:hypothetical protein TTHERM_00420370 [Tetrahymena thermophila SB210]EAR85629.2 hypothetical protein TTHERM_00420370 [Tetrahymena thermophila SB210]|eukprot:XP_001033292.2 hypothetical protein TTHERM_00420370 [Tetrahymena thermophila SB210]
MSKDDCIAIDRRINEDFMIAKTAELQSPISSKFKEGLNNLLEAEMTESDFKYSNKMVLNNLQTFKQSKSQSQSQTPVKNSIQASYNQPPINFKAPKNKKKKFRLFIQEQPFKVDGNSKQQAYQEYDPLQDKFLKDFFNGNKLKIFKKMQKNKNHPKKSEKNIKYLDQNKSQEIKCSSSQLMYNNNSKSESQDNSEDKKFIVSKYLTEISDDHKDNKKNISQFYGPSQSNQNNNLNSLTELSLDKIQISTKNLQFNKENFVVGKCNENNRYNQHNQNQHGKNKKTEIKQNCNNRVSEILLDKNEDFNRQNVQQSKSPLSVKYGIQNLPQISQHGPQFSSSKQNYLPKIQISQKNEQQQFNEIFNEIRSNSSNKNQPKANQYTSSQDYDRNENTNNKIHSQTKQKFYSIYQTQLNSNNQKNQITSSKPFYTFNGIQVQIPKPSKILTNKIEQNNQLPNLINQNTQKKLNLSLNLGSSSNYYQKVNTSFQEKQFDQQIQIQHSFDNLQPFISTTENKQNFNENYKFRSTLTKDQFNSFLSTFKQKYSPSNKNELEASKIFYKQLSSQQYESKLLKEYKESISNEDTI